METSTQAHDVISATRARNVALYCAQSAQDSRPSRLLSDFHQQVPCDRPQLARKRPGSEKPETVAKKETGEASHWSVKRTVQLLTVASMHLCLFLMLCSQMCSHWQCTYVRF